MLGLGTGGLGCYARPGEVWTFREIDPVVERIARDDRWFHFMAGCGNHPAVVLGDARLTLAADTAARYDLVIVDAFSSDSVPVHLITREALALYFARLKPGGIVLFHVSNRYLDLTPVVARLAADAGAPVRHLFVPPVGAALTANWRRGGGRSRARRRARRPRGRWLGRATAGSRSMDRRAFGHPWSHSLALTRAEFFKRSWNRHGYQ